MIRELLARAGLALLRKSAVLGFTATQSEEIRKFFAIHPHIARSLGYSEPSYSGKSINEYSALNISTVWACQRAISETVAGLPLRLMQQTDTGKRVASEHPLDWVLYAESNDDMSARQVRETLTAHCVTWGNAYALKVKRGGTGQTIGLWPITPDRVRPDKDKTGNRVYVVYDGTSAEKTYAPGDIFHLPGLGFDGIQGYSVVSMAKQSLGLAAIQDEYAAKFFAQGGRRPYVLQKKSKFRTDEEFKDFRDRWQETYASSDGFHKAPLLEGDIELQELGMPLDDLQLLSSRQFSVPDICRWFRMFPFMVGQMDQLTFNNVEQLSLQAVQYTYGAWINRWESEVNRQLLTEGEKGRYYAKHNVNALLRGDFKSRMEGYSVGLQNGFMFPDQVRDLEDWDPLPNDAGKAAHIQLNMQTLPGTGEPTTAERTALAKIQDGGTNAA
jgi:HK97 family phage portal protein